ncbi:MAG: FAD-dependent thymidylate synthase [bacterium]|nr:FAD-dependent thymidylate synthase [Acidimicrobiia bacterium]MCY4650621.1 FAD-dependent thymidylate synthase [bacterium]
MAYYQESFTEQERAVLSRFFTNLDGPVFALINLPEVVKGALFARYSRTHKSLRRLFLDEFVTDPSVGIEAIATEMDREDPLIKLKRAEDLYRRVFYEYGDDSVAQLGGVHLACEQASNLLTKVLEWGRLAAYLEQSTRYISYDQRLGGRYRYFVPADIEESSLREDYLAMMERLFDTYREMRPVMIDYFTKRHPRKEGDPAWVHRAAIRAKAFDSIRGLLPASTISNVGIYATGQAYEMAMIRMQSHPLREIQDYGSMMLAELRKVIPSFLTRVDLPDRGVLWSNYLADTNARLEEMAHRLGIRPAPAPEVALTDWDPDAERKLAAAALYGVSELPDAQLREAVDQMPSEQVTELIASLVGERGNRRHKPGRAMERSYYRFDVLCDFGAFRDLQRHRMMTIEWQPLTTRLGHERPEELSDAGLDGLWDRTLQEAAQFYEQVRASMGRQVAQYTAPFAYRIRFMMEMNARQALHLIELRTQPAGHPNYRRVCVEMHRQIAEVAGHTRIADAFKYLNTEGVDLERLEDGRRVERSLLGQTRPLPLEF